MCLSVNSIVFLWNTAFIIAWEKHNIKLPNILTLNEKSSNEFSRFQYVCNI